MELRKRTIQGFKIRARDWVVCGRVDLVVDVSAYGGCRDENFCKMLMRGSPKIWSDSAIGLRRVRMFGWRECMMESEC